MTPPPEPQQDPPLQTLPAKYGEITVFANDIGAVAQSLRDYGEWAENELAFLRALLPPDGTVLDIGAYIGTHVRAFAAHLTVAGRVHAFEAQPHTFTLLQQNAATAGPGQVALHPAAVSDRSGTVAIPPIVPAAPGSFGSASIAAALADAESEPTEETITVPALAIDDLALDRCDLIKIDAEGAEAQILAGARRTLAICRPAIYAECNALEEGLRSRAQLLASGYTLWLHLADAFNPHNANGNKANRFNTAREAALLGLPPGVPPPPAGPCGLLLRIETADDLALGLLNKPQYPYEILQTGAAATTGGWAFFADLADLRERLAQTVAEAAQQRALARQDRAALAERFAALEALQAATLRQAEESRLAANRAINRAAKAEADALAALEAATAETEAAAEARAAAAAATAAMDRLLRSRSWRLTAPLRAVLTLLRGRSGK